VLILVLVLVLVRDLSCFGSFLLKLHTHNIFETLVDLMPSVVDIMGMPVEEPCSGDRYSYSEDEENSSLEQLARQSEVPQSALKSQPVVVSMSEESPRSRPKSKLSSQTEDVYDSDWSTLAGKGNARSMTNSSAPPRLSENERNSQHQPPIYEDEPLLSPRPRASSGGRHSLRLDSQQFPRSSYSRASEFRRSMISECARPSRRHTIDEHAFSEEAQRFGGVDSYGEDGGRSTFRRSVRACSGMSEIYEHQCSDDSLRITKPTEFISPDVSTWTSEHVVQWIHSLPHLSGNPGSDIAEILEHQGVTGPVLLGLTDEDMEKMGIDRYGHRAALLLALKNLNGYTGNKGGANSPRSTMASTSDQARQRSSTLMSANQRRSTTVSVPDQNAGTQQYLQAPTSNYNDASCTPTEMGSEQGYVNDGLCLTEQSQDRQDEWQDRQDESRQDHQSVLMDPLTGQFYQENVQQQQHEYVYTEQPQMEYVIEQPQMVAVQLEPQMVMAPEIPLGNSSSMPYPHCMQYTPMRTSRPMPRLVPQDPQLYAPHRMVNPELMTPRSMMVPQDRAGGGSHSTMYSHRPMMVETPRSMMVSPQQVSRGLLQPRPGPVAPQLLSPQMTPRTMTRVGSLSTMTPRAMYRQLQAAAPMFSTPRNDHLLDCTMPTLHTSPSLQRMPSVHAQQREDMGRGPVDGASTPAPAFSLRRDQSLASIGYARQAQQQAQAAPSPRHGFQPAPQSARAILQGPQMYNYNPQPMMRYPQ